MKKVLVVTTSDDMIWHFLLMHIKQLQDLGFEVECACSKTGFFFDEIAKVTGCKMHCVDFPRKPYSFKVFKAQKTLKKIVKNANFSLIYCHQPVGGVLARLVGHKYKVPVLYMAHGFHFYKGAPFLNNILYKTIEKYCSRFTEAIITTNLEDFEASKKLRAKKQYLINGPGLDLSKFQRQDCSDLKKELGIKKNDVVVLSIGELNKNKNHRIVIETIKQLNMPNVKYLICGRGPRDEEYKNLIEELNLCDQVKLLGYRKDIPKILSLTDIYVMPSFREGLGMACLEAMCFKIPCIVSNIRGLNSLVEDNKNGFLIDPNNPDQLKEKLEILLKDNNLCKTFGEQSLNVVQKFSNENVSMQLEKIYKEIGLLNE